MATHWPFLEARLLIPHRVLAALWLPLVVFGLTVLACGGRGQDPKAAPTLESGTWAARMCGVVKTLGAALANNSARGVDSALLSLEQRKELGRRTSVELISALDLATWTIGLLRPPAEAQPFQDAVRRQYELLASLLRRQRDTVGRVTSSQDLAAFNDEFSAAMARTDQEINRAFTGLGIGVQGTITSEWKRAGCA